MLIQNTNQNFIQLNINSKNTYVKIKCFIKNKWGVDEL